MRRAPCSVWALCLVLVLGASSAAHAQVGMPDPSQMSGVPLPSPELSTGTMTVRVVRGSLSNNLPGQRVELSVQGQSNPRIGTTDAAGRAEFSTLRAGQVVQAAAIVDGNRIESQQITIPASGGIRVMLFAPESPAAPVSPAAPAAPVSPDAPAAPVSPDAPASPASPALPVSGIVVLGGETRFIVEQADESLSVFYILEILNTARVPVDPGGPLLFDLPTGATGATLLTGSTPQATVGGTRVTVTGPFAPGTTSLQVAYSMPYRGSRVTIEQVMPAGLTQVAVAGETTNGVTMRSAQFAATRDMNADGRAFMVGNGDSLPPGGTLTLMFDNLPHHPRWPRFAAFGGAVAIMAIGLLVAFSGRGARVLAPTPETTREALFAEIDALEARRRDGRVSETAYAGERERLLSALEDVYGAPDARG